MPYIDTNTRTTTPLSNEMQKPMGRIPLLYGVYVGFVKDASDVQRNGRLRVWIPELGTAPEEEQGWLIVSYCSPFAGATNNETTSKTNLQTFDGTQTSYGLWMIPPDINNQVLVMFINGDTARGVWIGCLYNQYMNNMIPGMAAGANNYQYPGKQVPLAEYNKWDTNVTQPDRALKPYEATKFKGLGNQGLITDQGRGITTSSARRESPSSVFGIITPGPVISDSSSPANIRRKGGSSFIMDDGTGSEYVQLTTKSGAQIKLDETNGFVYLINRDGTAWVQMDQKGNIDIFGATNISMRAQQDVNIRADRNINIEAGQNIFMKAAKDTIASTTTFTYDVNNIPNNSTIPYYKYVGEGNGEGGNIVTQALNNTHTTVQKSAYLTIKENDLIIQVNRNLTLTTVSGKQDYKSAGSFHIETNQEFDLLADQAVKTKAGTSIDNIAKTNIRNMANNGSGFFDIVATVRTSSQLFVGNRIIGGGDLFLQAGVLAPAFTRGVGPLPPKPTKPDAASDASSATPAEVKPLVQKINILAGWEDPESKFKRLSESFLTTVGTLPTYEPCPEHETFTFNSTSGYSPTQTEGQKTYKGSGGAGNDATTPPVTNTDPGANNTNLPPTPAEQSALSKEFNMNAYRCQLINHEGYKKVSYRDSTGVSGGIGHFMRTNELPIYPIGTAITTEQIETWFSQDSVISVAGAQRLLTTDTWGKLTDIRKRACADLCYNLGEGGLSKFTRFLASMKAGDYNAAGDSLRNSKWFTQVARRGQNIVNMVVNNIDPNGCDKKFPS